MMRMRAKIGFFSLLLAALVPLGCAPEKPKVRTPVAQAPPPVFSGPASELENQATSTPVIIPNVPHTPIQISEVKPTPPPEPQQPALPPKSSHPRETVKKEGRPPAPSETASATPITPAFQVAPMMTEAEKTEMSRKISQQLDSARALVRGINTSRLTSEQKTNLAAIQDFFRKSDEAMKRGDYYQALMVAQKANTLAASLAKP
jgi:hypothetical protein